MRLAVGHLQQLAVLALTPYRARFIRASNSAMEHLQEQWSMQQVELSRHVIQQDVEDWDADVTSSKCLKYIAGVDISFVEDAAGNSGQPEEALAALVVMDYKSLEVVHEAYAWVPLTAPYLPGYLGFREVPGYEGLLRGVRGSVYEPQLVLVDGYGVLHPRRCGSASHLGVVTDVASVGVAKNLLALEGLDRQAVAEALEGLEGGSGAEEGPVEGSSGAAGGGGGGQQAERCTRRVPLVAAFGETLGMAVVLEGNTKPVFVSVGHKVSLATAVAVVRHCCRYRVPEPIRQADIRSRERVRARQRQRQQQERQLQQEAQKQQGQEQ